jgi:peptidoglycan/xylan/chitin deacetylase (PgdA/CDA1 family)
MSWRAPLVSARRRVLTALSQRRASLRSGKSFVSFTFDDFPRTALTVGGEILRSCGARGTYYTAAGLMGTATECGEQFHRDDLDRLLRDGHELASHTFRHVSARKMPPSRFRDEVLRGQRAIDDWLGDSCPRSFAFPFGDVTLRAKRLIGGDVASSRSIWAGFNGPVIDLNLLRAHSLYGGRDALPRIRDLILENKRRSTWLIFYTHDVTSTPSPYGCTPELLDLAVSCAAQHSEIHTVADIVAAASLLAATNPAINEYAQPEL